MMNIKLPYRIPEDLARELLDYATSTIAPFKFHGISKEKRAINKFIKFDTLDTELAQKVKVFGDSIFNSMNMMTRVDEDYLGYSLIIVENGGYVQPHKDSRNEKNLYLHVRINFLIKKPHIGGSPIIDGVHYEIQEGDSWFNLASIWEHGCTLVEGDIPRVTLSIGKYVAPNEVKTFLTNLFKNH